MTKRSKPRRLRHRIYRGPASVAARVPPGELLLEFFTDQQLFEWRAQGKDYQSYHYLWYYELEAQRAANSRPSLSHLVKFLAALSMFQAGAARFSIDTPTPRCHVLEA